MNTHDIVMSVVIVLIVIFVIARQVFPKRITWLTFIGLPIFAGYEAIHNLPHPTIPPMEAVECAVTIVLSIAAGVIQARDTRLVTRQDGLYYQGGVVYIATWFGLILARMLTALLFQGAQGVAQFSQHEWMLFADVAVAWGTRSLLLCIRHPEIIPHLQQQRDHRRARRM